MKTIRTEEISRDLTAVDFLQALGSSDEIVIERNGQAEFVLVPAALAEQRREAKERAFAIIGAIRAQNADADSDDILRELEEYEAKRRSGR